MNRLYMLIAYTCLFSWNASSQLRTFSPIRSDSVAHLNFVCGNFGDNLPVDTLDGPWPALKFELKMGRISPDGKLLAATVDIHDWPRMIYGTVIIKIESGSVVKYLAGTIRPKWSPHSDRIVSSKCIYDIPQDSIITLPSNTLLYLPEWSYDGESIYYSSSSGIWRSSKYGTNMVRIGFEYGAIPIKNDSLVLFKSFFDVDEPKGFQIFDLKSSQTYSIQVPEWFEIQRFMNPMLSTNQRFLVADIRFNGGSRFNQRDALCLFDLKTYRMKKILPAQAFSNPYYPSWTPWGTLLVSFVCRLDSSYTVWEIDTNGVFLRQLTNKHMLDTPTSIRQSDRTEESFSLSDPFPNPTSNRTSVSFTSTPSDQIEIEIFDVFGRKVQTYCPDAHQEVSKQTWEIDASKLNPGFYVVRLTSRTGFSASKKFVVTK